MAEMSANYYYHTDADVRKQIDELLHQNALIQCNLGTDSTKEERQEAKANSEGLDRQADSQGDK